ncbi:MAG: sialidase family protein [Bryobacteraceae bacterium]
MTKQRVSAALLSLAAVAAAALIARDAPARKLVFEDEPRLIGAGRSPQFLPRRQHGLLMTFTKAQDLYFQASNDLGDTFTDPVRVNDKPGEVSDHGENSPQLLASPGERDLYAIWSAKDARATSASLIRFSRANGMNPEWAPAITLNDDSLPASHSFQGAAVGPDGTIYAAWLDGREKPAAGGGHAGHGTHGSMAGTSAIYISRSLNNGRTFEKNVRVAGNVCPCCRVSIGFSQGNIVLAWRGVEEGDLRDITTSVSSDRGATWTKPALAARDGWKLNGCPHVGPSLASLGGTLWVTWFSEGGDDPAIYLTKSTDGGRTFQPRQRVSGTTLDPTHPYLTGSDGKLALVFQARDEKSAKGWGKFVTYYREIYPDGNLSSLVRAGGGKANANYPTAALGLSGRIFLGWSENSGEGPKAYLLRGRALAETR